MIRKTLALLALSTSLFAQLPEPKISGFVDTFYSYDTNTPSTKGRQDFLYNHNRHNEFNINLALLKLSLDESFYRANVALQAGTYAEDNYPDNYENLYEANAGVALTKDKTLWLDGGIFTSHLGFESAISTDNYTLTRSLAAESSPYYLTGAKLTYTPSTELEMAFVVSNGWQTIEKTDPNTKPSIGTQLLYKPNAAIKLNWSTFAGEADELKRCLRLFNNLYAEFLLDECWSFIAGLDSGGVERTKGSSAYDTWHIASLLSRYKTSAKSAVAFRAEYLDDPDGVIINANGLGAQTLGLSSNLDYYPHEQVALRLELRYLQDTNAIYKESHDESLFYTASLALKF